jgi:hypothetical protein
MGRARSTHGGEEERIQDLAGKPEGRRREDNIKMDPKRNRMGWYGPDPSGSRQGPGEVPREHGNEPSGSAKWEILEKPSDWRPPKKDRVPRNHLVSIQLRECPVRRLCLLIFYYILFYQFLRRKITIGYRVPSVYILPLMSGDQISHPCRATRKVIVLYVLIFMFSDSRREDKMS